jgi:hypothetical protein
MMLYAVQRTCVTQAARPGTRTTPVLLPGWILEDDPDQGDRAPAGAKDVAEMQAKLRQQVFLVLLTSYCGPKI